MRPLRLGVVLLCVLAAGPCEAAGKRKARPERGGGPAFVEELVVRPLTKCLDAKPEPNAVAPKVIGSYPAEGAVIRPGWLVVRLTFDQPMTCSGYMDEIAPFPRPCARGLQHLVLSLDRRTLRTLCVVEPNLGYALRLSEDENALVSLFGAKVERFDLTFRTSSEPLVTTIPDALAQDTTAPGPRPQVVAPRPAAPSRAPAPSMDASR
jgi:hypothetical protein